MCSFQLWKLEESYGEGEARIQSKKNGRLEQGYSIFTNAGTKHMMPFYSGLVIFSTR